MLTVCEAMIIYVMLTCYMYFRIKRGHPPAHHSAANKYLSGSGWMKSSPPVVIVVVVVVVVESEIQDIQPTNLREK